MLVHSNIMANIYRLYTTRMHVCMLYGIDIKYLSIVILIPIKTYSLVHLCMNILYSIVILIQYILTFA